MPGGAASSPQGTRHRTHQDCPNETICRRWSLESEDGRLELRTLLSADSSSEGAAEHDDGRDPDKVRHVEGGHHDEPQTSSGRGEGRSERVIAVDVRARRHKGRALVMRTRQEIRQVTRRKRRSERQQNLCNQPERAQLSQTSRRHVPVARGYIFNRQIQPPEEAYSKERPLARAAARVTNGAFTRKTWFFSDPPRPDERFRADTIVTS
jgi:hypothetical protein